MSTETSAFGVSKRESHDASRFYRRGLEPVKQDKTSTFTPPPRVDFLRNASSESMVDLVDNSVSLMVTSPPYHVGKEYDTNDSFENYLGLVERVMKETYRVLEPGGRAVVNVAGLGRKPYVSLPKYVDEIMQDLGYHSRGEVLWVKAKGASGSCAWGTFQSAKNPVLRDLHEYFLVYSKDRFDRCREGESTISKADFMAYTLSIWEVRPESAKRVGHPAPFPVEIPRRFIELYSYKGDLILDPFIGSGSTAIAAVETDRHYAGYDTESKYVDAAAARVAEVLERKSGGTP